MTDSKSGCVLCRGIAGDAELLRIQVWEDSLWRVTMSLEAEILGFAYLEPKRHIPHITDLDKEGSMDIWGNFGSCQPYPSR
jgi:diadenosine tetraphosphate (Ap4A) HIT family hydrolase